MELILAGINQHKLKNQNKKKGKLIYYHKPREKKKYVEDIQNLAR